MKLDNLEGKKVVIEATNNKVFRGVVSDYVYPEDNENNKESIIIKAVGYPNHIEFYESDIKSLHEIK